MGRLGIILVIERNQGGASNFLLCHFGRQSQQDFLLYYVCTLQKPVHRPSRRISPPSYHVACAHNRKVMTGSLRPTCSSVFLSMKKGTKSQSQLRNAMPHQPLWPIDDKSSKLKKRKPSPLILDNDSRQALGILHVDSLHVAVELFLGILFVVPSSGNPHTEPVGDTLDAALPDLLVELRIQTNVRGTLEMSVSIHPAASTASPLSAAVRRPRILLWPL